jgi:hypothetical protein
MFFSVYLRWELLSDHLGCDAEKWKFGRTALITKSDVYKHNIVLYYWPTFFGFPTQFQNGVLLEASTKLRSIQLILPQLWQPFLETNCFLIFKALQLLFFIPLIEFNGLSVNWFLLLNCHSQHQTQSLGHNYDLMPLQISSSAATWWVNLINEATHSNVFTLMKIAALYIFIKKP